MKNAILSLSLVASWSAFAQSTISYGTINDRIYDVQEMFDGKIYALGDDGLYRSDLSKSPWTLVLDTNDLPGFVGTRLEADGFNLYIGTWTNGLVRLRNGNITTWDTTDGLPNNKVNDISITPSGQIWVATDSGLAQLNSGNWVIHDPFLDHKVNSVEVVGGDVYAVNSSFTESMKYFDGTMWQVTTGSILSHNSQRRVAKGPGNAVMVSHAAGLSVYDNGTWTPLSLDGPNSLVSNQNSSSVFGLDQDNKVYLWDGVQIDTLDGAFSFANGYITSVRAGRAHKSTWIAQDDNSATRIVLLDYLDPGRSYREIGTGLIGGMRSNGLLFDQSKEFDLPFDGLRYNMEGLASSGGLWLGARSGNTTKITATEYNSYGSDWAAGPVSDVVDLEFLRKYDRLWFVTKAQIENHINSYNSALYTMPDDIRDWPGNGDTTKGQAWILAPFVDVDLNGKYEPHKGDYPEIRGEQALFAIANDVSSGHLLTGSDPLGVELHVMMYTADTTGWDMEDKTLFLHFELKPRNGPITALKRSLFIKSLGRIGYSERGSDSRTGSIYSVFYSDPTLLKGVVATALGDSVTGTRFTNNFRFAKIETPSTISGYWNAMDAKFNDGSPIYTATGLTWPVNDSWLGSDPSGTVTRFHLNWADWLYADDVMDGNLLISEDKDLYPGQSQCLDFAVYVDEITRPQNISMNYIDTLLSRSEKIQAYYDSRNPQCLGIGLATPEINTKPKAVMIYPNPTFGFVELGAAPDGDIQVINALGQPVMSVNQVDTHLDLSSLKPGLYTILYRANGQPVFSKVIVRR